MRSIFTQFPSNNFFFFYVLLLFASSTFIFIFLFFFRIAYEPIIDSECISRCLYLWTNKWLQNWNFDKIFNFWVLFVLFIYFSSTFISVSVHVIRLFHLLTFRYCFYLLFAYIWLLWASVVSSCRFLFHLILFDLVWFSFFSLWILLIFSFIQYFSSLIV